MKALTWHGRRDVRVDTVPDPTIEQPTDAIIRVTSTGLCGSDLHLYEVLGPFLEAGDVLGHEPMGIVEAVGSGVDNLAVGDRVVVPFNISCGHCFMCEHGLQSQCETTQNRDEGMGASLFGYTKLYGEVPGGQAELLRVPQAHYGPIKVPEGPRTTASSSSPTSCRRRGRRCSTPRSPTAAAWRSSGWARSGRCRRGSPSTWAPDGHRAGPRARAAGALESHGVETLDVSAVDDVPAAMRELTGGRGPDAVIDAVGMEAHGAPAAKLAHTIAGLMPDPVARKVMENAGVDRLGALRLAVEVVRRGGTISLSGSTAAAPTR